MNEYESTTSWETAVARLAREYPYPPTPDFVAAGRRAATSPRADTRRPAPSWAVGFALLLALLALGALAVPQSRAAVLTFIGRIGAIRLFVDEAQPPIPTAVPATAAPVSAPGSTATPVPLALLSAVPGDPVLLTNLNERAGFPVWLPPDSAEWGAPDSAVLHRFAGRTMVTLVWDDPEMPGTPALTLSQTDVPQLAQKMIGADQITNVTVNGLEGVWITGPHQLQFPIDGGPTGSYLASNVLVWTDDGMTFRIEGDITEDEALRLAAALSPGAAPGDNRP